MIRNKIKVKLKKNILKLCYLFQKYPHSFKSFDKLFKDILGVEIV